MQTDDRSLKELLSDLSGSITTLFRKEIQLADNEEETLALQFRLGQTLEQNLRDLPAAIEAYRDILSTEPTHGATLSALTGRPPRCRGRSSAGSRVGYRVSGRSWGQATESSCTRRARSRFTLPLDVLYLAASGEGCVSS